MSDIDKTARDLPRVCLHGHIPTATTMALAARVVELLEDRQALEVDLTRAVERVHEFDLELKRMRGRVTTLDDENERWRLANGLGLQGTPEKLQQMICTHMAETSKAYGQRDDARKELREHKAKIVVKP